MFFMLIILFKKLYSGAIIRTIVQKMSTIHNERAPVILLLSQMVRLQASRKRKRERERERERERIIVFTYFRVEMKRQLTKL